MKMPRKTGHFAYRALLAKRGFHDGRVDRHRKPSLSGPDHMLAPLWPRYTFVCWAGATGPSGRPKNPADHNEV